MSKDQKKSNDNNYNGQDKKFKGNRNGGRNLRGPDTNSSGPFRNGAQPIQCYNCGGWGHKAYDCPSPLNYKRGEASGNTGRKMKLPQANDQCRAGQSQPRQYKTKLRTIQDHYHNPDPVARLICKRNETKVIVDEREYPGLLDSGAQMSTITISQANKMGLEI